VTAAALATKAMVLLYLGRFAEAERALEQAHRAVRAEGDPGTELLVHHSIGLLSMARRQFDEAFAAFEAAERMQTLLAGEHAFSGERRSRIVQVHAWMGEPSKARLALAALASEEHDLMGVRIAEAAVHLVEGSPEQAVAALVPGIERRERSIKADWAAIDASLLDALARDQLGDRRAAEASIERALDLAEPEGVALPFILYPVRDLLERHPRHRTAHATLLSEILDVLAGSRPARDVAAPPHEELQRSRAARGPVPAEQPPGHRDRGGAVRLVEHGADAPAPHLRQARRAQPLRGRDPCPRARPAGSRLVRALTAPRRITHRA
jgi:LuxR family transcriptional regulator, maltose regulon positive regulatory protein